MGISTGFPLYFYYTAPYFCSGRTSTLGEKVDVSWSQVKPWSLRSFCSSAPQQGSRHCVSCQVWQMWSCPLYIHLECCCRAHFPNLPPSTCYVMLTHHDQHMNPLLHCFIGCLFLARSNINCLFWFHMLTLSCFIFIIFLIPYSFFLSRIVQHESRWRPHVPWATLTGATPVGTMGPWSHSLMPPPTTMCIPMHHTPQCPPLCCILHLGTPPHP